MKTLFTIQIHSIIGVITNSSSELFVGKSHSKETIEELIKEVYPNYLNEYEPLMHIEEMTTEEFKDYLDWTYWSYGNDFVLAEKFKIDPKVLYSNLDERVEGKYWNDQITDKGAKKIKDIIDPKREMYFLYSIEENPNREMQEKLMVIMERYHLG